MDRILRKFSSSKHHQSTSSSDSEMDQRLKSWTIPKVGVSKAYSKVLPLWGRDSPITTFEHTMTLKSSNETLPLLSKDSRFRRPNKKTKYLHCGLVQVAVKPLRDLGQDSPILLCLCDSRLISFKHSLLATVESNLQNGPVFFNYQSTYSVVCAEPDVPAALTLHVQTKNIDFQENLNSIALTYRVYYKVTDTPICVDRPISSSVGETQFYEGDFRSSEAFISRKISRDQVISSSNWNLPPDETESS